MRQLAALQFDRRVTGARAARLPCSFLDEPLPGFALREGFVRKERVLEQTAVYRKHTRVAHVRFPGTRRNWADGVSIYRFLSLSPLGGGGD